MAKKFGKFLLITAAIGTAAAAIHYYRKNNSVDIAFDEEADLTDDMDAEDTSARNYVPLSPNLGTEPAAESDPSGEASDDANKTTDTDETSEAEENVEEFFDEDAE